MPRGRSAAIPRGRTSPGTRSASSPGSRSPGASISCWAASTGPSRARGAPDGRGARERRIALLRGWASASASRLRASRGARPGEPPGTLWTHGGRPGIASRPPCSVPGVCSRSLSPARCFSRCAWARSCFRPAAAPTGRWAGPYSLAALVIASVRVLGALHWLTGPCAAGLVARSRPSRSRWPRARRRRYRASYPLGELVTRATAPLLAAAVRRPRGRLARSVLAPRLAMGRPRLPPAVRELRARRARARRRSGATCRTSRRTRTTSRSS